MAHIMHVVTFSVWTLWIITYWGTELKFKSDVRATILKAQNSRLDQVLTIVIGLSMIALFAFMLRVALGTEAADESLPVISVGFITGLAGMMATFFFRRFMGRFWRPVTAIQQDHQVVQSGPYGIVRHPIYTAILLMYAGLALAFSSLFTWLVFAIMVVSFAFKTLDEERFLTANLENAYQDYRNRVHYRLIPGVW